MALSQQLPVSRLVSVQVNLQPLAAQFASFSSLLVVTDNPAVNVEDRIVGPFSELNEVVALIGVNDPAYLAAALYFSQIPTPSNLFLGRWASGDTNGMLVCGIVPPPDRPMSNWTSITNGGFTVAIDGGLPATITGLNFSTATNLNGVASLISTALSSHGASCAWNGFQFVISSLSTGTTSSVSFLSAPTVTGVSDISDNLFGTSALAQENVEGIAAETPLEAVAALDNVSAWYGCMFASTAVVSDDDHLAVAGYIEGAVLKHIYGVTTQDATGVWNPGNSSDIGSAMSESEFLRTFVMYSSYSPVAAASVMGIAFSTDWSQPNSAYTLMYKVCYGLQGEAIGPAIANTMDNKRVMYFAQYQNQTTILGFGEMSGPAFFDEIHGTDWFANDVQTSVFNVLYTSRKVPQTDPGEHLLAVAAMGSGDRAQRNGLIAAGQWNAAGIGTIAPGDNLPGGIYVYMPPVATQAQADREARKAVPMYILLKLAGAVHTANVLIQVQR